MELISDNRETLNFVEKIIQLLDKKGVISNKGESSLKQRDIAKNRS